MEDYTKTSRLSASPITSAKGTSKSTSSYLTGYKSSTAAHVTGKLCGQRDTKIFKDIDEIQGPP